MVTREQHEYDAWLAARDAGAGVPLPDRELAMCRAYHEALLPGVVARVREEALREGAEAMRRVCYR